MARIATLAGLLIGVLLTAPASARDDPPNVILEVSNSSPDIRERVSITLEVSDPEDPSAAIEPAYEYLQIEVLDPTGSPLRLEASRHSEGIYSVDFAFYEEGTWTIKALPDVTDRNLVPEGSIVTVTLEVRQDTGTGVIALVALIAGGVIVMLLAGNWLRRPKGAPKAKPIEHDTWWFSP
jgi:hypothetical protein